MGEDEKTGNGHEPVDDLKNAIELKNLTRGNGVLTLSKAELGVLQKLATSSISPELVGRTQEILLVALLQELKLSNLVSIEEADRTSAAITERVRYGVDLMPIVTRITARSAVRGNSRAEQILKALTHIDISQNKWWSGKQQGKGNDRNKSPLA